MNHTKLKDVLPHRRVEIPEKCPCCGSQQRGSITNVGIVGPTPDKSAQLAIMGCCYNWCEWHEDVRTFVPIPPEGLKIVHDMDPARFHMAERMIRQVVHEVNLEKN